MPHKKHAPLRITSCRQWPHAMHTPSRRSACGQLGSPSPGACTSASREVALEERDAIVAPEHRVADDQRRCAEWAAPHGFVCHDAQLVLGFLRIYRSDDRVAIEIRGARLIGDLGVGLDVAIVGP